MINPFRPVRAFMPSVNGLEPRVTLSGTPSVGTIIGRKPMGAEGEQLAKNVHDFRSDGGLPHPQDSFSAPSSAKNAHHEQSRGGGPLGGGTRLDPKIVRHGASALSTEADLSGTTGSSGDGTLTYTTASGASTSTISSALPPTSQMTTATTSGSFSDEARVANSALGTGATAVGGGAPLPLPAQTIVSLPGATSFQPLSPAQTLLGPAGQTAAVMTPADDPQGPPPPVVRDPIAEVEQLATSWATSALVGYAAWLWDNNDLKTLLAEQKQAGGPGANPVIDASVKYLQQAVLEAKESVAFFKAGTDEAYAFLGRVKFENTPAGNMRQTVLNTFRTDLHQYCLANLNDIRAHSGDQTFLWDINKKGLRYAFGMVDAGPQWPYKGD